MLNTNEKGFTLVEVLVSMAIFAVGILAVINMQLMATQTNMRSRHITEAIMAAQSKVEELRGLPYDHNSLKINNGDNTLDTAVTSIPGKTITEELNLTDRQDYSHPLYKLGWNILYDTPVPGIKTVRVVVKWMNKKQKFTYDIDMLKSDGE